MAKRAKTRKPRTAYGYRVRTGRGTILERRLVLPETWSHRQRLVELDEQHGMGGAWVDAIDDVFPASWLREQVDGAHEIARSMCRDWPIATRNIAEVADAIVAMKQARDGHESVAKRLQVHEQYVGALFEARVARLLRDADLSFTFASSKGADGPAADLHVEGAHRFVAEVKHVKNAFRAEIPATLTRLVSPLLPGRVPLGSRVVFDWSGDDVLAIEGGAEAAARTEAIASRAVAQLRTSMAGGRLDEPRQIHVDGAGVIQIVPGGGSTPNALSYETVAPPKLNERRLASRIRRTGLQIGAQHSGVMFLCSEPDVCCGECTAQQAAKVLRERGESYPQLAGAVVFVPNQNAAVIDSTWPVPNPFARTQLSTLPFPEARAPMQRVRFKDLGDPFGSAARPVSSS